MSHYFMDLEFLCDEDNVYEDDIIALCVVSEDGSFELTSLVKPDYEDFEDVEVSEYCTALTGISHEDLSDQPYFSDLHENLAQTIGPDDVIYVWGDVDLEAVYKASMAIAGELAFAIEDFQETFMQYCNLPFRPGLKKVYDILTDDADSKHHDVRSDTLMLKKIYELFQADKKAVMRQVKGRMK